MSQIPNTDWNSAGSKPYMRSKLQYTFARNGKKCFQNINVKFALIFFSSGWSGGGLESADPAAGREGGGHVWQGHHKEE